MLGESYKVREEHQSNIQNVGCSHFAGDSNPGRPLNGEYWVQPIQTLQRTGVEYRSGVRA